MKLSLAATSNTLLKSDIQITGSKSESNRSLLLQALYPAISIDNLSNSDDASVMQKGLNSTEKIVDIHHAGTAMRFLTSYFASKEGSVVTLTGSKRMTERPIRILVDALRSLGADIEYVQNEGYPPLKIRGKKLTKDKVSLAANISSQYISSLLLIAPSLSNGLTVELVGEITSVPYIKMTLALLKEIGVEGSFEGNFIHIQPKSEVADLKLVVESDWSSASYYYSIVALCEVGTEISLSAYKKDSLQGDSTLAEIYADLGVETEFRETSILIKKTANKSTAIICNLADTPDLAQTIAVSCFGLGLACELSGLHTLKIKETDRLEALHTELSKLGASIRVTDNSLHLEAGSSIKTDIAIDTYNDHRMAMAFAPLALKTRIQINDAGVVSKSYPDFWRDLKNLHFEIEEQ